MPPRIVSLALAFAALASALVAQEAEEGFVALTDGKSFNGWKASTENPGTWKLEDGAFVSRGPRSHLFYVGDGQPFKNFELKVEVMTEPGSNGGIYFHTKYQETGWPKAGFETQVNNTQSDWRKTGSVYAIASTGLAAATDNKWWTQHVIVQGNKVTVKIDGKVAVEYVEPAGTQAGGDFERKLGSGTFALQGHDPKSIVHYRNIRVKRLPD
ncbi:MAG TPA: DUF1080 domain-containing protein [Opitutaceae bacterium]|nr:DUF1080 domain-containing protein [Opitutaceae bacterium]